MAKYRVTIPLPDGATSIAIWEYDMDSEQIWAMVSEAVKEEYGEYPTEATIELIGGNEDDA